MTRVRCAVLLAMVFLGGAITIARAEYSVTDVVDAAKRGDYHAVHKLIEDGVDLGVRGPMGYTALHWAGVRGHWRIFAELVAAGAPVNAHGTDGGTPLHWTCHHDRPDAVRLLLDAGADHGRQDVLWMRSRHAHAYWRLGSDWSLYLAKLRPHYQDLEKPISDERCLLCHTTGSQDPEALFEPSFRPQEGVSCEACHGPGSNYAALEVMTDREAFLAAGGRMPNAETCRSCHRNSDNFEWAEFWPKIAHPREQSATGSDE